jgi:hypothetical protein
MKTNDYLNNIVIVGTNRASLHSDLQMQESIANIKFESIREALRGQAMENNVCQTYFAVDENQESENCCCNSDIQDLSKENLDCECPLCQMKLKIYHTITRLPRLGMRIPESWVTFEKVIQHWMVDKGMRQHRQIFHFPRLK